MKKFLAKLSMLTLALVVLVAAKSSNNGYGVGDTVADFKLKNTDGKMVALSDYKSAKGAIVIFDCNTCPYSKAYNSRIIELNKKYASKGFPVIAIQPNDPQVSPGDSFEEMVKLAKNKKYDFPYLFDETQQVARAFGATNTPHVYLLKKEGNDFKVVYIGSIDDNARDEKAVSKRYVEENIEALLTGKAVPTDKTKAIGCTIKWRNA